MTDLNHVCTPDPNGEAAKLMVAASLGILANSGGAATYPRKKQSSAPALKFVGN
jgi:hypothetical protein